MLALSRREQIFRRFLLCRHTKNDKKSNTKCVDTCNGSASFFDTKRRNVYEKCSLHDKATSPIKPHWDYCERWLTSGFLGAVKLPEQFRLWQKKIAWPWEARMFCLVLFTRHDLLVFVLLFSVLFRKECANDCVIVEQIGSHGPVLSMRFLCYFWSVQSKLFAVLFILYFLLISRMCTCSVKNKTISVTKCNNRKRACDLTANPIRTGQ